MKRTANKIKTSALLASCLLFCSTGSVAATNAELTKAMVGMIKMMQDCSTGCGEKEVVDASTSYSYIEEEGEDAGTIQMEDSNLIEVHDAEINEIKDFIGMTGEKSPHYQRKKGSHSRRKKPKQAVWIKNGGKSKIEDLPLAKTYPVDASPEKINNEAQQVEVVESTAAQVAPQNLSHQKGSADERVRKALEELKSTSRGEAATPEYTNQVEKSWEKPVPIEDTTIQNPAPAPEMSTEPEQRPTEIIEPMQKVETTSEEKYNIQDSSTESQTFPVEEKNMSISTPQAGKSDQHGSQSDTSTPSQSENEGALSTQPQKSDIETRQEETLSPQQDENITPETSMAPAKKYDNEPGQPSTEGNEKLPATETPDVAKQAIEKNTSSADNTILPQSTGAETENKAGEEGSPSDSLLDDLSRKKEQSAKSEDGTSDWDDILGGSEDESKIEEPPNETTSDDWDKVLGKENLEKARSSAKEISDAATGKPSVKKTVEKVKNSQPRTADEEEILKMIKSR